MGAFRTFALLFLLGTAQAQFKADEEGVLVLDSTNFDQTLADNENGLMVEFYAPWCGHCKKLAPEYKKAANKLMQEDPPIRIAMVDATVERSLAEKFGVRGFPTLKFFKNGEPSDYEGGRTERDIVAFMKKKTGPAAELISDASRLEKVQDSSEVIVVGHFEDMESAEGKLFMEVAGKVDDYDFFYTTEAGILADAEKNSITILKDFDEGRNAMTIKADTAADDVVDFVVSMSMPKVIEFSQERTKQIFRGPVRVHLLTFVDTSAAYFDEIKETLNAAADENRGKILHIYVPSTEDRVMDYFGFKKTDLPKTVLADMRGEGGMKKYIFEGKSHTAEALIQHEKDFFDGVLKPTLKSEEDKPANMKGPVKVITGNTFEEHVMKSGKDVLLEFYAPWCGHCKALAPKWDELGEKFEEVDSVMIAKMDATANEIDHPDVNVRGFPTIYYFPAEGSPVKYEGGRELGDFTSYLQKHATKSFEVDGTKGGPDFKDEL